MKTTKEFPATHSMSTEWFVVDEEGNIALFDFDENGPVPVDIPEQSVSYLMTAEEDFGEKDSDTVEYLEMSDEQIEEIMHEAVPPEKYDIKREYNLFVEVNEKFKKDFLDVFIDRIDFCLSHKHNIYYIWSLKGIDEPKAYEQRSLDTFYKTVKRVVCIYVEDFTEDNFDGNKQNWPLPFYVFKQPYSPYSELAKRTNIPKFPFKENQIPEKQRHKLIRIPVKFSECTGFQIAQYAICGWYSSGKEIERKNRYYTKFPLTEGGFKYFLIDQDKNKDGEIPITLPAGDL